MKDTHLHDAQLTEAHRKIAQGELESRLKNDHPSYCTSTKNSFWVR